MTKLATPLQLTFFFVLTLAVHQTQAVTGSVQDRPRFAGDGFTIELIDGTTATKRRPVGDFELYEFKSKAGIVVLGAYSGFHPSFPAGVSASAKRRRVSIDGMRGERIDWRDTNGALNVQILLSLNRFAKLHLFCANLAKADIKLAEALIASVKAP